MNVRELRQEIDNFETQWEDYDKHYVGEFDDLEILTQYYQTDDQGHHIFGGIGPADFRTDRAIDMGLLFMQPTPPQPSKVETQMSNEAMMTPLQRLVVDQIDDLFDTSNNQVAEFDAIDEQIRSLTNQKHHLQNDMKEVFIQLLCLVTVDVHMFCGRNHKVPLIRIHRKAHECGLRESKDAVEEFVNKPSTDILF